MPTFQPPYADTVSPVGPAKDPLANRLMRHYKSRARGQTVLKLNGEYVTRSFPLQSEIDAATEVYLGGHVYTVSTAVGAALTAAGYTIT